MVTSPVLNHHHRDVIWPGSTSSTFTTAMTWWTRQSPLPLERFKEEGLINLNDALFPGGLMGCHRAQEAVTPEERGVFADPTAPRSLADSQSFDEGLRVVFPALCFTQSGQGRLGQNGAGAQTQFATVAAQPPTPSPRRQLGNIGLTMGAATACR